MVGAQGEGGCSRNIPDRGGGVRWCLVKIIGDRLFRVVKIISSWAGEMLLELGAGIRFGDGVTGSQASMPRQKSFP